MSGSFWQKRGNKIITYDVKPVTRYQGQRAMMSPRGRTTFYDRDSPIRQRRDEEFVLVSNRSPRHGDSPVKSRLKRKMRNVLEEAGHERKNCILAKLKINFCRF